MTRLQFPAALLLVSLAAWLAAQCVLTLWHAPAPLPAVAPAAVPAIDLLADHWQGQAAPATLDELPLTTLELEWIGGLRAEPLSATVVVLGYQQRQRTLTQGQRLAPGIVLERIDERGLIFDHHGRRERLPWPPGRPLLGLKRHG